MNIKTIRALLSVFVPGSVLILLCWWFFSAREPRYEGRPVSSWFHEYCRLYYGGNLYEAQVALQKMGSNATPYLVQEAFNSDTDSPAKSNWNNFVEGLPRPFSRLWRPGAEERRYKAIMAMLGIKPPAHQIMQLVQRHLKSKIVPEHDQALMVLGTAGDGAEEVVSALVDALPETNGFARVLAIQSLGWIGPRASAAVPSLIEVLQEADLANDATFATAMALKKIGSNAAPALPLLRHIFESETNWERQCDLAAALLRISPDQSDALAFLTNALMTHLPASERSDAARELGEAGQNARDAIPLFTHILKEMWQTNFTVAGANNTAVNLFFAIPPALKNISVEPETYLPLLRKFLQSNDEATRANVAANILYIVPADQEAQETLIGIVKNRSLFRGFAIDRLGRAGPAAAEAIPVLNEMVKDKSSTAYREAAERAIRLIESNNDAGKK